MRNSTLERISVNFYRETRDLPLRIAFLILSLCSVTSIVFIGATLNQTSRVYYSEKQVAKILKVVVVTLLIVMSVLIFVIICVRLRLSFFQSENTGVSRGQHLRLPRSRLHLALMQRDFTADDYEMLQQLDEGVTNISQGASEGELRRLPIHRVTQSDQAVSTAVSKSCSICLADFQINDAVKSLPCLHRFHEKCIDKWLRDKAICPVCKFPAVGFSTTDAIV